METEREGGKEDGEWEKRTRKGKLAEWEKRTRKGELVEWEMEKWDKSKGE